MFNRKRFWPVLGLVALLAPNPAAPAAADDVIVPFDLNGNSLTLTVPTSLPFAGVTLSGTDQTKSAPLNLVVNDSRGTGDGWNLTITSTPFTGAGTTHPTLATTATTILGPVYSACLGGTCTDPTNGIPAPLTVPAAATPPAAAKFFNAAVDTGLGEFSVVPTFKVAIPANTIADTYTSTLTVTLATGP